METGTLIAAAILGPAIAAVVAYNTLATYVIVKRRFFGVRHGDAGGGSSVDDEQPGDHARALCPYNPCEDGCG